MMKSKILAVVLGALALTSSSRYVYGAPPASDEADRVVIHSVLVANYRDTPANRKVGVRISAIFKAHHIGGGGGGLPACANIESVSVSDAQADEARRVLARAVLDEGLPISIYGPASKDGRMVVVAPEAILGLSHKH